MKKLTQHIEEKLIINKNFKNCINNIDKIVDEIFNNTKMTECINKVDNNFDSQEEFINILVDASLVSLSDRNLLKEYIKKHISKWWANKDMFTDANECIEYFSLNHSSTIIDPSVYKLASEIENYANEATDYDELHIPRVGRFNVMIEAYQTNKYVTFIMRMSNSDRFILLGVLICKL